MIRSATRKEMVFSVPAKMVLSLTRTKRLASKVVYILIESLPTEMDYPAIILYQFPLSISVHPCETKTKGGCAQICEKKGDEAKCKCQKEFKLGVDNKSCITGKL